MNLIYASKWFAEKTYQIPYIRRTIEEKAVNQQEHCLNEGKSWN